MSVSNTIERGVAQVAARICVECQLRPDLRPKAIRAAIAVVRETEPGVDQAKMLKYFWEAMVK